MQTFRADKYRGQPVRLTAWVKGSHARWANIWMRVDSLDAILAFDNMRNRRGHGNFDWRIQQIVLDVPYDAATISYGLLLDGSGQAWVDDFTFEIVGAQTASTDLMRGPGALRNPTTPATLAHLPAEPVNTDFDHPLAAQPKLLTRSEKPAPPATANRVPAPTLPETVIRIDVNLVQVDAVVTDSHGHPVTDLNASDFEVFQDGKPQVITNFSYKNRARSAPPAPTPNPQPPTPELQPSQVRRTIAIVVDNLGMPFADVVQTRIAIQKFLAGQVEPGDLVAILRTSDGMGALEQFTSDPRVLQAAAGNIIYAPTFLPPGDVEALSNDPLARQMQARAELFSVGTLGSIRAVVEAMHEMPGRKSLILFSENLRLYQEPNWADPEDRSGPPPDLGGEIFPGMREQLQRLVDAANRSSVVIYTIDPRGLAGDIDGHLRAG